MSRVKTVEEVESEHPSENGSGRDVNEEQRGAPNQYPRVDWAEVRKATKAGEEKFVHKAVYPEDSILAPFMTFVQDVSEGVDAYIIGSILPIIAATLARRVYVDWDNGPLFPNLFSILVGRAGDRKSSVIKSAEKLGWRLLPTNAFLPTNLSVESLFDEYYEPAEGRPDKIWVCDEANVILANWKNSSHGERVSAQFLQLFDCKGLSESFVRNKKKDGTGKTKRIVEETSTSILLGATPGAAAFAGAQVKAGMARRFLYYCGDGHGRFHAWPKQARFEEIINLFKPLLVVRGAGVQLSPEAWERWENYQRQNRTDMDQLSIAQETLGHRLNTCPTWVLKIAMLFEAARAVHYGDTEVHEISEPCLKLAIEHVEENLRSAEYLDNITEQERINELAEITLAVIRGEFQAQDDGTIYCTKSELTRRFCSHGRGSHLSVEDLYSKLIPALEKLGLAKLVVKQGRLEVFAFAPEKENQLG